MLTLSKNKKVVVQPKYFSALSQHLANHIETHLQCTEDIIEKDIIEKDMPWTCLKWYRFTVEKILAQMIYALQTRVKITLVNMISESFLTNRKVTTLTEIKEVANKGVKPSERLPV